MKGAVIMKKFVYLLIPIIPVLSACSMLFTPEPTATTVPPTQMPTAVPTQDPCSGENIVDEVEEIQYLINDFREILTMAPATDVTLLYNHVFRMQDIRRQIIQTEVPQCLEDLRSLSIDYASSAIYWFVIFINVQENESEVVLAAENTSNTLWQQVVSEFDSVLSEAGVERVLPADVGGVVPPGETGVFLTNDGTLSVNVRERPDTDADIVASLESGMQATALSRTEDAEWVQINLDGVLGWVSAETVLISEPVEDLPVLEEIP